MLTRIDPITACSASMLLGRQMNLDKARELALSGDLAGLAEEVKNQVGSQAEFEAMNVIERQSLAKAIGVNVSDLGVGSYTLTLTSTDVHGMSSCTWQ